MGIYIYIFMRCWILYNRNKTKLHETWMRFYFQSTKFLCVATVCCASHDPFPPQPLRPFSVGMLAQGWWWETPCIWGEICFLPPSTPFSVGVVRHPSTALFPSPGMWGRRYPVDSPWRCLQLCLKLGLPLAWCPEGKRAREWLYIQFQIVLNCFKLF